MSTVVDTLQARTKATEVRTDFLVALKDNKYGTAIGLALKEGGLRARLIIGFLAIGLALVLYLLVKVTLTLFR